MEKNQPKLLHIRAKKDEQVLDKGGYTIAFVKEGDTFHVALSVCRATQKFSHSLGGKVALRRLETGACMLQTKDKLLDTINSLSNKVSNTHIVFNPTLIED